MSWRRRGRRRQCVRGLVQLWEHGMICTYRHLYTRGVHHIQISLHTWRSPHTDIQTHRAFTTYRYLYTQGVHHIQIYLHTGCSPHAESDQLFFTLKKQNKKQTKNRITQVQIKNSSRSKRKKKKEKRKKKRKRKHCLNFDMKWYMFPLH